MKAVHLHIYGLVQGVYFRKYTRKKAIELGLQGWVRNCADGSVEAFAQGDNKPIDDFVKWCHHGPEKASVTSVTATDTDVQNFKSFEVHRDY